MDYSKISSSKQYSNLLGTLYAKVKEKPEEIDVPRVKIIAVEGNRPPGSKQFQDAITALYGIGYALKMGLKFDKLPKPAGYFDYGVGGLEAQWWSTKGEVNISDPKTLRWRAYLMLPAFINKSLVDKAREQASAKHPETDYDKVSFEDLEEGRSVQAMHIGPYDREKPTIDKLINYITKYRLKMNGPHHEIYISDPRRTKPDKLKTVIRYPVKTT